MQQGKKTVLVHRPNTPGFVPIEVAAGECVGDVLAAIGARGALGLSTSAKQPSLVLLPGAVLWTQIPDGASLYIVDSCCPCS